MFCCLGFSRWLYCNRPGDFQTAANFLESRQVFSLPLVITLFGMEVKAMAPDKVMQEKCGESTDVEDMNSCWDAI